MASRLVNVRLDPARIRKAETLREQGVTLSDVLRKAIDEQFEALQARGSDIDARAVVQRVFERHPDPAGLPPRDYDVHDRRAAGTAIRRAMKRTRR